ncbi:MAG: hypothetical protein Tsb002_33870 [Wenzhouxiangellaceae bacterium]
MSNKSLKAIGRTTQWILLVCLLAVSSFATAASTLTANQWLHVNDSLTSTNGDFRLVMQGDGNLVLYRLSDSTALWSSQTNGNAGAEAVMQGDGNLVVYKNSVALWASNTSGNPMSFLNMQDDGNLVVYSSSNNALWESDTRQPECSIQNVPVWGGKFETGFWDYQLGTCFVYVPLQPSPAPYYHQEYVPGYGYDTCVIYPTFSGTVPLEICE